MPGNRAADLAALDALFKRGRIFSDDYKAGVEYAHIARRCGRRFYRPLYIAAVNALDRSGGRQAVDAVVVFGRMPATEKDFDAIANGLDALATHFRAEGLL